MIAEAIEASGFGLFVELVEDLFASIREVLGIFALLRELAVGAFSFLLGG